MAISLSSAAQAQDADALLTCKKIKNEVARLNCYDAQVAKLEAPAAPATEESKPADEVLDTGKWLVENALDPMTDEATFTAALAADSGGSGYNKPTLFIRCKQKSAEVFVSWGDYLGDNTVVTTRFGDDAPGTFSWSQSTDSTATFLYSDRLSWFFESAVRVDKLATQITPYQSGPITAVFDLRGISNILTDKKELCGIQSS